MRRFICGFFVGVAYSVSCLLSWARTATSMLGMGSDDEDVDSEVGTVVGGDSEFFESDEDGEE